MVVVRVVGAGGGCGWWKRGYPERWWWVMSWRERCGWLVVVREVPVGWRGGGESGKLSAASRTV